MIVKELKFKNTPLEQKDNAAFTSILSYKDLKDGGFKFKPAAQDKGNGCFVVAKSSKDVVFSIPCGKSVAEGEDVTTLSYGVCEDNTLVAYKSSTGEWI
jgi:hypothetical protein